MRRLWRFWSDDKGSVAPEWALITTILVLGAITGIVASRQASQTSAGAVKIVRGLR